jgi:hypothetical protein
MQRDSPLTFLVTFALPAGSNPVNGQTTKLFRKTLSSMKTKKLFPRLGVPSSETWVMATLIGGLSLLSTAPATMRAATITVTTTADSGAGTLRAALASAANGDTIDATGVTGTILLTSGTLFANGVTILGPGPANLAVDGNAAGRVFYISGVTLAGLTITNGRAPGGGGGIFTSGTLIVSNCTVTGNSAPGGGGGIYNGDYGGSGTAQIVNSTLSGNSAGGSGGGIYNDGYGGSATVQIVNSTLSGNSAGGGGGAIFNSGYGGSGTVQIANSTLSGNSAGGSGGGIYNNAGGGTASVEIGSSILKAGASGGTIANLSGTVSSDGYNLASDSGGGFLTATADQINTDPMLGPLQNNGGPTFTHGLLPGSPAIDMGKNLTGSATDQRGVPRTMDGPCIADPLGGDGTDIGAFEVQQPCPVAVSLANVGAASNQFGFDIAGASNQVVVVEASTNLGSWTPLATNTLGAAALHFIDSDWTNFQQRFYRVKLAP